MDTFVELKTEYCKLLEKTEQALTERHLDGPAKAMHAWRLELDMTECGPIICTHVQRTRRSLGGMHSIGEIASTSDDRELLILVESLCDICMKIESKGTH